jgi:hypothetical protein
VCARDLLTIGVPYHLGERYAICGTELNESSFSSFSYVRLADGVTLAEVIGEITIDLLIETRSPKKERD